MTRTASFAVAAALVAMTAAAPIGCTRKISDKDIRAIGSTEVARLIEPDRAPSTLLADTRPPADFAAAHIPGARNIPFTSVRADGKDPDPMFGKFKTVVVYGKNPGDADATTLTKRLLFAGFKHVRLYRGGMSEWVGSGMPTDPPQPAR